MLSGRRPRGFSIMEIVVVLAIIALLTGVITPVIIKRIRYAQAQAAADTFDRLRQAILLFKEHTTEWPIKITQLQGRPDNVIISATRACGGAMSTAVKAAWQGPYLDRDRANPNTGFTTGEWTINDLMVRVGNLAATDTARLFIQIPSVPIADANRINELVDGPPSEVPPQAAGQDTSGAITWAPVVSGSSTVSYGIVIRGC